MLLERYVPWKSEVAVLERSYVLTKGDAEIGGKFSALDRKFYLSAAILVMAANRAISRPPLEYDVMNRIAR